MKNKGKTAIILLLLCVIIVLIPLVFFKNSDFGGADDAAFNAISEINPDFKPWMSPVFEPPGSETESLLFCLQAAIGAGIIGFGFGTLKERSKNKKQSSKNIDSY